MKIEDYLKDNERLREALEKTKDLAVARMRERVTHIRSPLSSKDPPGKVETEKRLNLRKLLDTENKTQTIKFALLLALSGVAAWLTSKFRNRETSTAEEQEEKKEQIEKIATKTYVDSVESKIEFAKDAYQGYLELGLGKEAAIQMAGQDANESGWGTSQTGSFNFGGIKWVGDGEEGKDYSWVRTTEFASEDYVKQQVANGNWRDPKHLSGKKWAVTAKFRNFKSYKHYAEYKWGMLQNDRYNIKAEDSAASIRTKLYKGGYATSPSYVKDMEAAYKSVARRLPKEGEPKGGGGVVAATSRITVVKGPDTVDVQDYETYIGFDSGPKVTTL